MKGRSIITKVRIRVASAPFLLNHKYFVKTTHIRGPIKGTLRGKKRSTSRKKQEKGKTCIQHPSTKNNFKKRWNKVIVTRKKVLRRQSQAGLPGVQVFQSMLGCAGPQGIPGIPGLMGLTGPAGLTGPVVIPQINSALTARRYSYIASADMDPPVDISAGVFTNDDGVLISEFPVLDQNSYANLYINGILQAGGTYSVTPVTVTILQNQDTIFSGTSIILEMVQLSIQITS